MTILYPIACLLLVILIMALAQWVYLRDEAKRWRCSNKPTTKDRPNV